jgi:hypothetical protein
METLSVLIATIILLTALRARDAGTRRRAG